MNFFQARIQISVFAATIAILAGCTSEDKPKLSVNDHFRPDNESRAVHNVFDAQAAIAAREDGQLYAHHFTGATLNSLGRQKLAAMTGGREVGRISVYLVLPKDGDYGARQNDVIAFLQSHGVRDEAFTVVDGPNPNIGAPAAQGLAGLARQKDNGGDAGGVSASAEK